MRGILLSLFGGAAGFALALGSRGHHRHTRLPAGSPLTPDLPIDWQTALFASCPGYRLRHRLQRPSRPPCHQNRRCSRAQAGHGVCSFPATSASDCAMLPWVHRLPVRCCSSSLQDSSSCGLIKEHSVQTNFNPKTMAFLFVDPVRDGYTPEKARALFRAPARSTAQGSSRSPASPCRAAALSSRR